MKKERRQGDGEVGLMDENYKTNVPINATLIGTMTTATIVVLAICVLKHYDDTYDNGFIYGIMIIGSAIYLPLVLALIIWHQRKTAKTVPAVFSINAHDLSSAEFELELKKF